MPVFHADMTHIQELVLVFAGFY